MKIAKTILRIALFLSLSLSILFMCFFVYSSGDVDGMCPPLSEVSDKHFETSNFGKQTITYFPPGYECYWKQTSAKSSEGFVQLNIRESYYGPSYAAATIIISIVALYSLRNRKTKK